MKKLLLVLMAAAMAMVVSGCAQKLTRAETLALDALTQKAMTRTYEGFTSEQLIEAAAKALEQTDSSYKLSHKQDGFFAHRSWMLYYVLGFTTGADNWRIKVNGSTVTAISWPGSASNFVGAGTGSNTGNPGVDVMTVTSNVADAATDAEYYLSPPLYDLFFARLEYFLGKRADWAPCVTIDKGQYKYGLGIENGNDPLCFHTFTQDPTKKKGAAAEATKKQN